MQTFHAQIAANRRNSFLLVLIVVGLLVLLGFSIGYALTGEPTGGLGLMGIAGVLAIVLSLAAYFSGDRLVLAASGAREVDEQSAPQLVNVVREISIAANVPPPRSTSSTTPRQTRSRPVAIRSTPRSRRPLASWRSSIERSSKGLLGTS